MPPATAAPPPAPAQSVTIVDLPPPPPPPPPTGEIKVSQMTLPPGVEAPGAPKRGTARARMFQELAKRAKPEGPGSPPPASTPTSVQPEAAPSPEAQKPAGSTPPEPAGQPGEATPPADPAAAAAPPEAGKDKKASPWKLVETYKSRAAQLEQELAKARTESLPAQEKSQLLTQIESLQKRNTELEDEMRFTNYAKSEEFKSKYVAPYESAWKRATEELSEIPVKDTQTGEMRPAKPEDLLMLVNMPLGEARALAQSAFGDFADDVMAHRKEIKSLFSAQQQALEEAKTKGGEREKLRTEQMKNHMAKLTEEIGKAWTAANEAAVNHPKVGRFFKPMDGDEEYNKALTKGYELADKAFTVDPRNPQLTPEQRNEAIGMHSALRNRAAAFGPLRLLYERAAKELEAVKKELAEIKSTSPSTGGGSPAPAAPGGPVKARDQVFGALRAIAK